MAVSRGARIFVYSGFANVLHAVGTRRRVPLEARRRTSEKLGPGAPGQVDRATCVNSCFFLFIVSAYAISLTM